MPFGQALNHIDNYYQLFVVNVSESIVNVSQD